MTAIQIRPGIQVDDVALAAFARRHHVTRLALYGSSLRGEAARTSDIDVLVTFEPGRVPGLLRIAQMELELGELVGGHEVELRTYGDLSRFFRDEVASSARVLYAA